MKKKDNSLNVSNLKLVKRNVCNNHTVKHAKVFLKRNYLMWIALGLYE